MKHFNSNDTQNSQVVNGNSLKDPKIILRIFQSITDRVVPLIPYGKEPLLKKGESWKDKDNLKELNEEVIKRVEEGKLNIGLVLGYQEKLGLALGVIDFDSKEAVEKYKFLVQGVPTLTVETLRGKHFYFSYDPNKYSIKNGKLFDEVEIKTNGYVVIPPSKRKKNEEDFYYEILNVPPDILAGGSLNIPSIEEFSSLLDALKEKKILKQLIPDPEPELELIPNPNHNPASSDPSSTSTPSISNPEPKKETSSEKKLSEEQKEKIIELLKEIYKKGNRNFTVEFLSGWGVKNKVCKEDILKIVERLANETEDEEKNQRIKVVEWHYEKKKEKEIEILKGFLGLKELFEKEGYEYLIPELSKALELDKQIEIFGEFVIASGKVFYKKEEIGPAINLVKLEDLEEGNITYLLIRDHYEKELRSIEDFETIVEMTGKPIIKPTKYKEYLSKLSDIVPIRYSLKRVGWINKTFYHPWVQKDIHFENKKFFPEPTSSSHNLEQLREALREGKRLAIVYLAAISSLLLRPLKSMPMCSFLVGFQAVGKTTATLTACSLFYSPDAYISGNTTQVGLELYIKQFQDLPIAVDELALSPDSNEEILVFQITSGKGRTRGTKKLTVDNKNVASNAIFTTEVSPDLIRGGAHRRILTLNIKNKNDLTNLNISKIEPGGGEKIIEFINSNYDDIINYIKTELNKLEIKTDKAHIAKLLYGALFFMERFYNEKFDNTRNTLKNLLEKDYQEYMENQNPLSKTIDTIKNFFVSYKQNFINENEPPLHLSKEIYGAYKVDYDPLSNKRILIIYFLPKTFDLMLKKSGLDPKSVKSLLKESGILEPGKNETFRYKKKINGVNTNTYKIILKDIDEEET